MMLYGKCIKLRCIHKEARPCDDCDYWRDIGAPAEGSTARPIELGHMWHGREVTRVDGGVMVGTVNVNVCQGFGTPVFEGAWLNGTRMRVRATGECGSIYEFTPEGIHKVYGDHGQHQADKPAEYDTYWLQLDKHNVSYWQFKYTPCKAEDIQPVLADDPDYVFTFDHVRAKREFDAIAAGVG